MSPPRSPAHITDHQSAHARKLQVGTKKQIKFLKAVDQVFESHMSLRTRCPLSPFPSSCTRSDNIPRARLIATCGSRWNRCRAPGAENWRSSADELHKRCTGCLRER